MRAALPTGEEQAAPLKNQTYDRMTNPADLRARIGYADPTSTTADSAPGRNSAMWDR